jgi:hypothetical protein
MKAISREELSLRLHQPLPPGIAVQFTLHAPHEPLTVHGAILQGDPPEWPRPGDLIRHVVRLSPLGWKAALHLALLLTALS